MAAPTLPPPPITTPIIGKDGSAAPTWVRWLNLLWNFFSAPALLSFGAATANWEKGTGDSEPRYWKDGLGMVHVMGHFVATGVASNIPLDTGSLPGGYKPRDNRLGAAYFLDDSTGMETLVPLFVDSSGRIVVTIPGADVNDELVIEATFLAEQ